MADCAGTSCPTPTATLTPIPGTGSSAGPSAPTPCDTTTPSLWDLVKSNWFWIALAAGAIYLLSRHEEQEEEDDHGFFAE